MVFGPTNNFTTADLIGKAGGSRTDGFIKEREKSALLDRSALHPYLK
jgi:hypothetical protein